MIVLKRLEKHKSAGVSPEQTAHMKLKNKISYLQQQPHFTHQQNHHLMSSKDELKQLQINTMQQVTGSTFGPSPSFYSRQNSNSRIKTPVANQSTSFAFNNYNLDQQHYDDNLYLGSSINESNMSLRHNSMIKGHSFQQQQNFADRQIPMNSKYYKRESVLESQAEDDSLKEEEEEE